jgi:hypothetical protein
MYELEKVPDTNILLVTAKGKITDDDYEDVLIPAIESTLQKFDKVRILVQLGEEYDGFEAEAMWDDTKVGLKNFTHFEKCAIVSDLKWLRRSIKAFGFLIPGEVKLFSNEELAAATGWIKQ